MNKLNLDNAVALIEQTLPEVWKRVYTKHIDSPGNYFGNKAVSVSLAGSIFECVSQQTSVANVGCCAAVMERFDYPIYYVHENFLSAMQRTLPPKDMKWSDMYFPFPGLSFMLPRNTVFNEEKKEIGVLGIARLADVEYILPGTKIKVGPPSKSKLVKEKLPGYVPGDRICVWWALAPSFLAVESSTFPSTSELKPSPDLLNRANELIKDLSPMGYPSGEFSSVIAALAANLVLSMSARPEMVERGKRTSKVLKSGKVIHTPTFLGRKYEIRTDHHREPGTSHFTELGWRCGHYRRYHVGVGRKEEVLVLIDPYMAYCKVLVRDKKEDEV